MPERRCAPYDAEDYPYPQSVEDQIIDTLALGGVYGPYTGRWFDSKTETDIEHIVARSEAHDSGLCAADDATRRGFATDLLNLTLAAPAVNRNQKRDLDAAEWLPYTLAIHRGGAAGENPHAHLMFSERGHDGIERSGEQWFKRYNAKAPEKGGARKSRAAKAGDWLDKTREEWEQTANRALERAGHGEQIDRRSLADRREEAYRAGDLERAAELSREPNVHLGPARHRGVGGAALQEKLQKAARVERMNAADRGERNADSREVERVEREIAGIEARLKETYDRDRAAIDERIRQAGRAIRAGAEAAGRAGRALGRAGARIGRTIRAGGETVRRGGELYDSTRRGPAKDGYTYHEIDRRLRKTDQHMQRVYERVQRARGGFKRTVSLIHAEAEQKRTRPEGLPDRVEGRIESLIQGAMRSREHDIGR